MDIGICYLDVSLRHLLIDLELNQVINGMGLTEAMGMRRDGWKEKINKKIIKASFTNGLLKICDIYILIKLTLKTNILI